MHYSSTDAFHYRRLGYDEDVYAILNDWMVKREAGTERDLPPSAKLKVCVALAFAKFNGWARERARERAMTQAEGMTRPTLQPLGSTARAAVFKVTRANPPS